MRNEGGKSKEFSYAQGGVPRRVHLKDDALSLILALFEQLEERLVGLANVLDDALRERRVRGDDRRAPLEHYRVEQQEERDGGEADERRMGDLDADVVIEGHDCSAREAAEMGDGLRRCGWGGRRERRRDREGHKGSAGAAGG